MLETAVGSVFFETIANAEQLQTALAKNTCQLVFAHLDSKLFSPDKVLAILRQTAPDLPCIVIASDLGKEAIELMKAGATDVVLKDDVSRLGGTVAAAIQERLQRTPRIRAERALQESEQKFSRAFHISPDSININRLEDGLFIDINAGFTQILGYTRDDVKGRSSIPGDLSIWVNLADRERLVAELKARGEVIGLEAHFRAKDGRIIIGLMSARVLQVNGENCILSVTRDITDRKKAEAEREATIRLLRFCNQHDDTRQLLRKLTLFFKEITDCEAIGIRLREGADFPYYETHGFPRDFIQDEGRLCLFNEKGELRRDEAGNPVLACMCGQVLKDQLANTKPNLTKYGSFWTNNYSCFASTTDSAKEPHFRGRCIREGYESMALIPLRGNKRVIGLLQFNDRRPDRFSAARIEYFESLAEHVATALIKLDTERALRSSEEHLRAVLETSEAGYFFIDPKSHIQNVNPAWLRLHGYEQADEVIGKHIRITQIEADFERATEIVDKLLAGEKQQTSEFSRLRKDGSIGYHTVSAHVVREEGQIQGVEGFLIDTTDLHHAQAEYRMLFEQMLDGFALHEMVFDEAGTPVDYRFLAINPAYERMTGFKACDVIGKTISSLLPATKTKWVDLYGEVVRTGTPKRFEDQSTALNKHFEVLAFRPQAGQFACLFQDITNRKQLEMQLLQAQKMEAIGQLAGGVAHDFSNILAATMMHLNLLQRVPELTPSTKDSLKELESEIKRATSLTRQLLLFSRRQAMRISTTDLNELLDNLLKMLRRLIGEHIDLIFHRTSAPLWIEADTSMVEQVVLNLCVNARDAMPQGGQLTIEAQAMVVDSTLPRGNSESRPGKFVRLSVTDTGCGIDESTLKHIYEPFFTTKDEGKGTGLGLATVYSIVKQHHGWIDVESTMGQGTQFRVFFPTAEISQPRYTPSPRTSVIKGGGEGILVVEDDANFRNMVVMTLKVLGYHVFQAKDGHEALAIWKIHTTEIDVVCTDQIMPGGISGLELCKRLRETKPNLNAIVCTGYSSEKIDSAKLAAQNIDFLAKPFTSESLANAIRNCIDHADRFG